MKKLLFIALSTVGLFSLPAPEASAAQPVAAPVTQSGPTVLPGKALEAPVVVVGGHRRRRYRYVRRPYYVHGVRRYHSVRVYF